VTFELLFALAILVVVLIGHFGIWITLYNRINATGLKRTTIKRIEKAIVLACGIIPILLLLTEWTQHGFVGVLNGLLGGTSAWSRLTIAYSIVAGTFGILLAPFWIMDRPHFATAKDRYEVTSAEDLNLLKQPRENREIYVQGGSFRKMSSLPGNQIVSLQRNCKRLKFKHLPKDISGLRVAHLSDVHLTGQLTNAFYRLATDWIAEQCPDMIILSGDIVDNELALQQLQPVFDGLSAPLGMYFVLGNHDRRLVDPTIVCRKLCELGWTDLGKEQARRQYQGTTLRLIGNEQPWFQRSSSPHGLQSRDSLQLDEWTIGVSHSPDQFAWGIKNRCQLMLCGHTHGGQIRFPIVGPIVAPSWYGSRYASGIFEKNETVMHVSRGVSGVHPFRWGCLPEVSVLELTSH